MSRLFLVDGLGALVTASMLGLVLTTFEPAFGMPTRVLVPLASVAAVFAAYSFTCYAKAAPPKFLLPIAIANTLYCAATLALVLLFHESLTWLGHAYFLGEIAIVLTLVRFEVRAARA